ncbi:hypothetical protein [Pseudodesulfovibrio piezophilus]|uniref:Tyr recombinase domain-containing protein n=1 Tax=Pseudodesulfovibrio piezophilus (strain DSM 21447 / JCM 15486 / C1TLV30) TaxID=1322246 RepID=M1WV31_PSEP2|nr:hypothetical protein [Pseudodesulfovibrio piezophilus]CCH48128.1 protein of unknown function [Pseudodesulfovibrio piezophilus C1TLV30]
METIFHYRAEGVFFLASVIRKGLCSIAGIKPFTARSLRHHVASRRAYTKKFTTRQLKNLLHHKTEKTTEIYLHELGVDKSLAQKLDTHSNESTHDGMHKASKGQKKTG